MHDVQALQPSLRARALSLIDLHHQIAIDARLLVRVHLGLCREQGVSKTEIISSRGLHSENGVGVLKSVILRELQYHHDFEVVESSERWNPGSITVIRVQNQRSVE